MDNHAGHQPTGQIEEQLTSHTQRPALAKVTPPRLRNVLARERLFRSLNQMRELPLLWVSAPAGSGKTTLIASWIATLGARLVWYHCDEGDGDIASFFHFLSLTVASQSGESEPLPHLTPELYGSLSVFVRNFFREFFARLPPASVVVLDNWQDVPQHAALHDCLPVILSEVPHGILLVAISREEPPANLSRAFGTGQIGVLRWRDLQLTEAETVALVALYEPMPGQISVPPAPELYAATRGWAAGVTVLLRHESAVRPPEWNEGNPANQQVFDYLATVVFDRLDASTQEFMLKTACLKVISVNVARELTDNAQAEEILETFVRRNVFTIQRPASGTYQYHPLLKEFLQHRIERTHTPVQRRAQWRQAAAVLTKHRENEAAVQLWLSAEAWSESMAAIANIAPEVTAQGRFKILLEWLSVIPASERNKDAATQLWLGVCQTALGMPEALATLEAAYRLSLADKDELGQILSAVQIILLHQMAWGDLAAMLPWIDALTQLLEVHPKFPSKEVELRVVSAFASALSLVKADSPHVRFYSERARRLVDEVNDVHCRAYAVASLLSQQAYEGDSIKHRSLAPVVEPLLIRTDIAPVVTAQILMGYALYHHLIGERAICHSLLDRGIALLQTYGVTFFAARLQLCKLHTSSNFIDDRAQVGERLRHFDSLLAAAPPWLTGQLAFIKCMFYLRGGEIERALFFAEEMRRLARLVNYGILGEFIAVSLMVESYCAAGRADKAAPFLAELQGLRANTYTPFCEFNHHLIAAEVARVAGNVEECLRELRQALELGQVHGYAVLFNSSTRLFAQLIPVALEHDIETEYCHYLIQKRNLQPPSYDVEHWPWPIKIYTLGRFVVMVDGEKLDFSGKTQHKPLDLLKALLLNRSGVGASMLVENLWPDADGDAARNALNLALHRLRRLLKRKDAVLSRDGKLMLDCEQVWVDAWAVQALCERDLDNGPHEAIACAQKMLRLYRGHFLADQEHEWAFAERDRLRSSFTRRLSTLAGTLESQQRWEPLERLLSEAIELDPLNEPFHRALIRGFRIQGRYAECLMAYRRCRELFGRLLGTEPSAQLRLLVGELPSNAESESHRKDDA